MHGNEEEPLFFSLGATSTMLEVTTPLLCSDAWNFADTSLNAVKRFAKKYIERYDSDN